MKASEVQSELNIIRYEQHRREAQRELIKFICWTKKDYVVNWHHRALCRKLQDFIFGDLRFLMVFMPPRVGKSEIVSRRLPAFIHGNIPDAEIMAATYNQTLADEMTRDVQDIIDTNEFRELFPDVFITPAGTKGILKRNSEEYELGWTRNGQKSEGTYRGQGVGGTFSGRGANFIIIDDPVKNREDANSPTFRNKMWEFYTSTLRSRLEGSSGKILLTQTRWHEDDLSGRILEKVKTNPLFDRFEVMSFPALREDMDNPIDPRPLDGALWPEKFDEKEYSAIRAGSETDWAALYQQRPAALEGNIILRDWIRFYTRRPEKFDELAIFADLTFKEGQDTDFTVVETWGRVGTQIFLVDQIRSRMNFPAQLSAIKEMKNRFPEALAIEIEEAANGAAVIQTLKAELMGLIPIKPRTSKEARLHAVSPLFQSGNVNYPDESICPWVATNVNELLSFPNAKHDDTVDVCTMALTRLGTLSRGLQRLEALSRR